MGIFQPVPNQPLYVWPISKSAIMSCGYVRGNNRFGSLGLHGSVVSGVQSILPMYPSTVSKIPDKLFMYGYPLYTWYGRTPYGGSRFRIPLIVWIWNYIVAGVNITARAGGIENVVDIYATASSETSTLNLTYFGLSNVEAQRNGHVAYTTDAVRRSKYVMATMIPQPQYEHIRIKANLHQAMREVLKLSVKPVASEITRQLKLVTYMRPQLMDRTLKASVSVHAPLFRTANLAVSLRQDFYERVVKTHIHTRTPLYERVVKTHINTRKPLYERVVKTHINTRTPLYERVVKTQINTRTPLYERVVKTQINTRNPYTERLVKTSVRLVQPKLERTLKVSVRAVPCKIEPVWAFIQTNLVSRFHEDTLKVRSALLQHAQHGALIRTQFADYSMNKAQLINLSALCTQQKQSITADLGVESESQRGVVASVLEFTRQDTNVLATVHQQDQKVKVMFNPLSLQERWHRVEIDVLPLLAERKVKFFPTQAPFVEQIGVMITTCRTHVLAYLNFVPDEYQKDLDVILSTCPYTTAAILEWYLHGGRVTNEGGNEIIFDLGEVDPVGPIPPVPSRTWEGGYVEDPFKGLGYVPVGDSTGFGSPSADKWVSNTQMWWNTASNPWVDES